MENSSEVGIAVERNVNGTEQSGTRIIMNMMLHKEDGGVPDLFLQGNLLILGFLIYCQKGVVPYSIRVVYASLRVKAGEK